MSLWNDITKPVNKVLDSDAFKAVMPVQALGQEAVKLGSGAVGINNGNGLAPADQYAIGAGTGAVLAGGAAATGASTTSADSGASVAGEEGPMASITPIPGNATPAASPAASPWEAHASQARYSSNPMPSGGSGYNTQKKQNPMPMPPYPVIKPNAY